MIAAPDPRFADDDGSVDAEVSAALAAYAHDAAARGAVLAALQASRLLVPVVALLTEAEEVAAPGGSGGAALRRDKSSEMATVLMQGRDGRMALLAFTGLEPLRRWDAGSRPVPVTIADAARAARHDGAHALVLDVAGPVMFVVEEEELAAWADAMVLADLGGRQAWVRADVRADGDPC